MSKEIQEKLQNPFKPEEIEWRVGSTNGDKTKGLALPYITNRAIQNRLDEVFGCFGWKNEYKEWKGDAQLCGISIFHNGEWITKWDGADNSNMDGTKGGLSDSMKRAAYQWGIGRYLYEMPTIWVAIRQAGKSYVLSETPQVPKKFLPKDLQNGAPENGNKKSFAETHSPSVASGAEAMEESITSEQTFKELQKESFITEKECQNFCILQQKLGISDVTVREMLKAKGYSPTGSRKEIFKSKFIQANKDLQAIKKGAA